MNVWDALERRRAYRVAFWAALAFAVLGWLVAYLAFELFVERALVLNALTVHLAKWETKNGHLPHDIDCHIWLEAAPCRPEDDK